MNSVVKIVKRGAGEKKALQTDDQETGRQGQREIVNTVKGWIAELQQRRRAEERAYSALTK
jgi:N12 class adenine-specific DNA methylase